MSRPSGEFAPMSPGKSKKRAFCSSTSNAGASDAGTSARQRRSVYAGGIPDIDQLTVIRSSGITLLLQCASPSAAAPITNVRRVTLSSEPDRRPGFRHDLRAACAEECLRLGNCEIAKFGEGRRARQLTTGQHGVPDLAGLV